MRALSDRELLAIWDQGQGRPAWYRALLPLSVGLKVDIDELSNWPIGRRDGNLLALRASTLGPEVAAVSACQASECGSAVEVKLSIPSLLEQWPIDGSAESIVMDYDGRQIALRAPTSRDFWVEEGQSVTPDLLIRRCVISVGESGNDVHNEIVDISESMIHMAEQAIATIDPLAEIELVLTCPDCQSTWIELLNVPEFVWSELERAARVRLDDVHVLASSYGWTESEILGLSRQRRQHYRKLIGTRTSFRRSLN